jgi:hypothetical protein
MPIGQDTLSHIQLAAEDTDLILTVFFGGGPITGLISLGSEQRLLSLSADPFYRRQDNYLVSGSAFIRTEAGDERRRVITVLFTNASATAAPYRIELSSPRKLNFGEALPGDNVAARLFARSGNVPLKESIQFVFVVEH